MRFNSSLKYAYLFIRTQTGSLTAIHKTFYTPSMHWLYLIIAILLEVSGTTCMKFSDGLSKLVPTLFIFIFYGLSFTLLSMALKVLPIALTYAIWSGVGTAAITVIGVLWFGEGINAIKLISLLLIIIGVAGLHYGQEQPH